MNCIPSVIETDVLCDLLANWGTRVDRIVATVADRSLSRDIGHATNTAPPRGVCPCRAIAMHTFGRVCGCDATIRLNFRHGYMCSVGCSLQGTENLDEREYYALVERIRRALTDVVGTPNVLRHPHREDEVSYRWEGETAHVQLLSDQTNGRTIAVVANDPWICPWCSVH